jgi:hypothetical protein
MHIELKYDDGGLAGVSVHCRPSTTPDEVVMVSATGFRPIDPFVAAKFVGKKVSVTVFLTPDQARELASSLVEADNKATPSVEAAA